MGVEFIRNKYKVPFWAHKEDAFWIDRAEGQAKMFGFEVKPVQPIDEYLTENESIKFGLKTILSYHFLDLQKILSLKLFQ